MTIISLAWQSLRNRRYIAWLIVLSIGFSVSLLLGVERLRADARASFSSTIAATDLIIGARTSPLQLLLSSVFHLGDASNNFSWHSFQAVARHPEVSWAVPLALGDSHRGHRVVGTSTTFFDHYRYANRRVLNFAQGRPFASTYEAVLGAEVARALGYQIDDQLIIAHGLHDVALARHDEQPFQVVGVLARSGTPVDRSVFVSLASIAALHSGFGHGSGPAEIHDHQARADINDAPPIAITAALIGLRARTAVFEVQRFVNAYSEEPLTAILPAVTLGTLWRLVAVAEHSLRAVSACVVLVGLLGMMTAMIASLETRRREMAILRAVGARPWHVFALFVCESWTLTVSGIVLGVGVFHATLPLARVAVESRLGLFLQARWLTTSEIGLLGLVALCGTLIGLLPGLRAYRLSLADGLSLRL